MNFFQKTCILSLVGMPLFGLSLAQANETPVSPTQSAQSETKASGETSWQYRAGYLYGCLEAQSFNPEMNEQVQNMAIVAFCLCSLEGMLAVAVVEDSQVRLPAELATIQQECGQKVQTEFSSD